MRTGIVVAVGLCAAINIGAMIASQDREVEVDAATHNLVVSAIDDLWLQAVERGVNRERWPDVRFANIENAETFARTRCERPRPVITFNANVVGSTPADFTTYLAVPHELAHVLVCLDGDPDAWANGHGPAWEEAVRLLVPRDQAEDILEQQRYAETP